MIRMSSTAILNEIESYIDQYSDTADVLEAADNLLDSLEPISEAEYDKITKRLSIEVLDVERFVKVNQCGCVSDPRPFSSGGVPSPEGLLSNKIFGFASAERKGTFGYIDLHGWFLDPSCYKTWIRLDTRIKNIVAGIEYYSIDAKGNLVKDDEHGKTGLDFLRKNIDKIKFKESQSQTKKISIAYLEKNRKNMWINKMLVIPPFYRDANTMAGKNTVGLGGVNKLYNNLIVASNALTTTQEFGFDSSDEMKARVQFIMMNIYDWYCGNSNKNIPDNLKGQGMSGKLGILRMTNTSKTSDFSSRLVISPSDLKADKPEDIMITYDKSALPLYSAMTQFRDFVMFNARTFFENEFMGSPTYPVIDKNGNMKSVVVDAPEITFSDERIKKEMDRFLHGYNNRFVPVEVPVEGTNTKYYMMYKGRYSSPTDEHPDGTLTRRLTWCDIFYISAVEATRDKQILITRFPIDYFSNQFTTGVEVASTKDTEEIEFNGTFYKWYPKIREEDILTDTSNAFVDTMRFSNLYLAGIGGDYDGDQVTCKGVYTREANDELREYMNSKQNYITFGCNALREPGADSYQSIYALTKILSTTKVTPSDRIQFT